MEDLLDKKLDEMEARLREYTYEVVHRSPRTLLQHQRHQDLMHILMDDFLARRELDKFEIAVKTNYPVAVDSPAYENGAENFSSLRLPHFAAACEKLFHHRPLKALDVGYSGGGVALDFLLRGHLGVGVEASDWWLLTQQAEWRTLGDRFLFTADVSRPFDVKNGDKPVKFDVITVWDLLESIPEARLRTSLQNLKRALAVQGIVVGSVTVAQQPSDQHLQTKDWWFKLFVSSGFRVVQDVSDEANSHEHLFELNDLVGAANVSGVSDDDAQVSKVRFVLRASGDANTRFISGRADRAVSRARYLKRKLLPGNAMPGLNRLRRADIQTEPFLYFQNDSFLKEDLLKGVQDDWPDDEVFASISLGMGGRHGFGNQTPAAYNKLRDLVRESSPWRELYQQLNSAAFCYNVLDLIRPYAEEKGSLLDFDSLIFAKAHPSERNAHPPQSVFVDFNVSRARAGYTREPHHDDPSKIAVFLLYLNSLEEIGEPGGDLLLYRHKKDMALPRYGRFPELSEVELVRSIRPETNRLVGTVNARNAYHGVSLMRNPASERRFLYLALTMRESVRAWEIA